MVDLSRLLLESCQINFAMYVFLMELLVNLDTLENIDIVKFDFTPVTFLGIIYNDVCVVCQNLSQVVIGTILKKFKICLN